MSRLYFCGLVFTLGRVCCAIVSTNGCMDNSRLSSGAASPMRTMFGQHCIACDQNVVNKSASCTFKLCRCFVWRSFLNISCESSFSFHHFYSFSVWDYFFVDVRTTFCVDVVSLHVTECAHCVVLCSGRGRATFGGGVIRQRAPLPRGGGVRGGSPYRLLSTRGGVVRVPGVGSLLFGGGVGRGGGGSLLPPRYPRAPPTRSAVNATARAAAAQRQHEVVYQRGRGTASSPGQLLSRVCLSSLVCFTLDA